MNSLELSLNTAREAEPSTENSWQSYYCKKCGIVSRVVKDKLVRAGGGVACKNVSASRIRILIQIYSAGQVCFREIDNFTTASAQHRFQHEQAEAFRLI
jgi:hypothetical protein